MLRLLILHRSGGRILTDGGLTMERADAKAPATSPEAKARAVYSAFARFRERHCLPLIPRYPRASLEESQLPVPENSEVCSICCPAQQCTVGHSTARHGTARHGTAQRSTARHGTALRSAAQHGTS